MEDENEGRKERGGDDRRDRDHDFACDRRRFEGPDDGRGRGGEGCGAFYGRAEYKSGVAS